MSDEIKPAKLGIIDYIKLLFNGRAAVQEAINQGKIVQAEAGKSGIRTLAFWSTVIASVGAVSAQVGGLVPSPYGAIVMAVSPLLYSISRGLVKRDDPLGGVKPAMAASENIGNILAAAGQVALASSGAVSPEVASMLIAVHAAAIAASDALAKSGAQPTN